MLSVSCAVCGAEITDGVSFCRQCGERVTDSAGLLEAKTRVLDESSRDRTTRRLPFFDKGRGTARLNRTVFAGGSLLIVLLVLGSVLVFRNHNTASNNTSFIYPGAETTLDMKSEEGSVVQLRTRDSYDKVVGWYVANLKPSKNIKLSESSVLLKSDKMTVGIASENDGTNITIKIAK